MLYNRPSTNFLSGLRKVAFYGGDLSSINSEIFTLFLITIVTFIGMAVLLQFKIYSFNKKTIRYRAKSIVMKSKTLR